MPQRHRTRCRRYKRPPGAEPFCHACDPSGVERAKGALPARDVRRLQPDDGDLAPIEAAFLRDEPSPPRAA